MNWWSRKVLAWWLSNTMEGDLCVETLEDVLARHGKPEIFNTDQDRQFTNLVFTKVPKDAGVKISMDGRGRWMDSVMGKFRQAVQRMGSTSLSVLASWRSRFFWAF